MFFCILIYAAMAFILLFKLKKNTVCNGNNLLASLNSLRGIFALEIVIGHCVRYEACPLTPFGNFMLISVGYFFFVSGFGLAHSYHTKCNYLDTFIRHRIIRLIALALGSLVLVTIIAYLSPMYTDFRSIPTTLLAYPRVMLVRTNWYMRELLILYIFFYIVFRFFQKHKYIMLFTLIVALCIVLYFMGYTRCWFASIFCFPLGIIYYDHSETINNMLIERKGKLYPAILILSGVLLSSIDYPAITSLPFEKTEMIYALFNNLLCIGFISLLLTLLIYYTPGNTISAFLTSIATEIYLFQFVFVDMAEKQDISYPVKVVFVLTADIVIALIVNRTAKRLRMLKSH